MIINKPKESVMKTKSLILTSILTILILTSSLFAATVKWDYDIGPGNVMELFVDGSGGCAVVASLSTGISVFWFDKKGNKLYEKVIPGSPSITAVTSKYLVYQLQAAEMTQVQVNKKGQETSIADPAAYIRSGTVMGTPIGPMGDKKGFFVWKQNKSTSNVTIVRYSYK